MRMAKLERLGANWSQRQADLMIALVATIWGSSYLLMQVGLSGIPPFGMVALRFGIAFVAVAILFHRRLRGITASTVARGACLGFLLCLFFGLLMYGLETTPASTAGFLTSAKVVIVPIIVAVWTRRAPRASSLASIALCAVGLGLLTLNGPMTVGGGEGLCLLGSAVYALQIVLTDAYSRKEDPLQLGVLQLGFAALFGGAFNLMIEAPAIPQTPVEWGAVLGLALLCSGFGFVMQPIAQSHTTAEHAGLLFSLESVSSAVLSFVFLGEVMAPQCYLGCVLVLAAVCLSSLDGTATSEGEATAARRSPLARLRLSLSSGSSHTALQR